MSVKIHRHPNLILFTLDAFEFVLKVHYFGIPSVEELVLPTPFLVFPGSP